MISCIHRRDEFQFFIGRGDVFKFAKELSYFFNIKGGGRTEDKEIIVN